ncbi:MAG: penicillin-binding transpeptidase domain-containing protein [Candidatus Acidiferrales bacterium]
MVALLVCAPALTLSAASKKKPRRRAVRYTVPSYADPTANDSLAGESEAVRAVAARALGRYNGSVVVVEADSGRVLSIVNQELALSSGFKPCSTIKMAVGWGALEEGLITGQTVLRVSRYKSVNLAEALAYSDNTFFEKLGAQMGFAKVSAYARLLGFGELAGYLIENEYPGSFPMAPPANGGVARMSSYGEEIKVTPLQLAAQMAAFANGGTLYYLQYPRSEEEQVSFRPRIKRLLPIQPWLPELRSGMEGAVAYGTARNSNGGQEHMLGKTGTCGEDQAKLGWFASYGELSSGKRLAVVVLLRGGRAFNGGKAAEVAAEVYRGLGSTYELATYPSAESSAPAFRAH